MFHVEHRFFSYLLMILMVFYAFGCKKPPENPHSTDAIYHDFEDQAKATEEAIKKLETAMRDTEGQLAKTHAQSPQVKYFKNKREEQRSQMTKLEQQKRFWQFKIENRKFNLTYYSQKLFYDDKALDTSEQLADYKSVQRLRQAKMVWDQKKRVSDFKNSIGSGESKAATKEAKAEH